MGLERQDDLFFRWCNGMFWESSIFEMILILNEVPFDIAFKKLRGIPSVFQWVFHFACKTTK